MRCALLILVALLTFAPARAAHAQSDFRARLALSYLRLELALAAAPPLPAAERARINREFDRTTLLFFAGNMQGALGVIDTLVAGVAGAVVVAGALNPLAAAAVLEQQTARLREGGRSVEFRRLETEGHTLVVGEALPEVIRWLRQQLH
jgi:hypothetical protein